MGLDFNRLGIQSYAFSGHKIHGLKGTGALIARKDHAIRPIQYGGGQEGNLRSGTENTFGILALGEAVSSWDPEANDRMRRLKNRLRNGILERIPTAAVNGPEESPETCAPHILNIAMASRKQKISPVLKAMGVSTEQADCSLRFSLCPTTAEEEIDYVAERAGAHWEMLKKFTRR